MLRFVDVRTAIPAWPALAIAAVPSHIKLSRVRKPAHPDATGHNQVAVGSRCEFTGSMPASGPGRPSASIRRRSDRRYALRGLWPRHRAPMLP